MKCIECDNCRKGWFQSKPEAYVCIGVKEPFVIADAGQECTEYPEKRRPNAVVNEKLATFDENVSMGPTYYVDDQGIYRQVYYHRHVYECVMTKEMFVDAYNKWIKGENHGTN